MIFKYEKKAYNKYQNLVQAIPKNSLYVHAKGI